MKQENKTLDNTTKTFFIVMVVLFILMQVAFHELVQNFVFA